MLASDAGDNGRLDECQETEAEHRDVPNVAGFQEVGMRGCDGAVDNL